MFKNSCLRPAIEERVLAGYAQRDSQRLFDLWPEQAQVQTRVTDGIHNPVVHVEPAATSAAEAVAMPRSIELKEQMPSASSCASQDGLPQNPQFNPAVLASTPMTTTAGEFSMLPASRATLGRSSFAAISRILATSFRLVGSSSIAMVLMLSMPRVLGAVRSAATISVATGVPPIFPVRWKFSLHLKRHAPRLSETNRNRDDCG